MRSYYVPWLHMHQPLVWLEIGGKEELVSNLKKMLNSGDRTQEWNAKLMLRAYKNPAKYVELLKEEGYEPRIMLDFSGILLESLEEMRGEIKKVEVEGEKIGDIIKLYRRVMRKYPECMEFAGTAYAHCYFPVTPVEDWRMQVEEWRKTFRKLFGSRALGRVKGFWLPEMGVPAKEDLPYLLRILKDFGYEWIFLPPEAIDGFDKLSIERRIEVFCKPHRLRVEGEEIIVFIKAPYYFLDQQAGCDALCVYDRCLRALEVFRGKGKPPILIPASDGENGNVMMNLFFPETFVPFFKSGFKEVSSLTLSQFLEEFYPNREVEPIKVKESGGSWIGGHERWSEGYKKLLVLKRVRDVSEMFHRVKVAKNSLYERAKNLLLVAETSCYTYWGTTFWFLQGIRTIEKVKELLTVQISCKS